jgi:hypothetical protein
VRAGNDTVLGRFADAWRNPARIQSRVIVCSCGGGGGGSGNSNSGSSNNSTADSLPGRHSINLHFQAGRRVTCSISSGTRRDATSNRTSPDFLEPADAAAIDRAPGSRLVPMTKGPKCAPSLSRSLALSCSLLLSLPLFLVSFLAPSLSGVPHPLAISFSSRRIPRGRIRFFGGPSLKR